MPTMISFAMAQGIPNRQDSDGDFLIVDKKLSLCRLHTMTTDLLTTNHSVIATSKVERNHGDAQLQVFDCIQTRGNSHYLCTFVDQVVGRQY